MRIEWMKYGDMLRDALEALRSHQFSLFSLISLLLITSCRNDIPTLEDITTKRGAEVNMGFTLGKKNASTRMTEDNTKGDANKSFGGINYVKVIPYHLANGVNLVIKEFPSGSGSYQEDGVLRLMGYTDYNQNQARVYSTLWVPSTTNAFIAYGRSENGGSDASASNKFTYGSALVRGLYKTEVEAKDIYFFPEAVDPKDYSSLSDPNDDDPNTDFSAVKSTAEDIADFLKDVAEAINTAAGMTTGGLESTVARDLFLRLTHDGCLFSLNTQSLVSLLQGICDDADNAKLNELIYAALPTNGAITRDRQEVTGETPTYIYGDFSIPNTSPWYDFPNPGNLPQGVIVFQWNSYHKVFDVLDSRSSIARINPEIVSPELFAYPAQLWYYTNSRIHTYDTDLDETKWTSYFNTSLNQTGSWGTDKTEVDSWTRTLIIDKPLNYGVARLQMQVMPETTNGMLKSVAANGEESNIDVTKLKWSGVLVSLQHPVDFSFSPLTELPSATSSQQSSGGGEGNAGSQSSTQNTQKEFMNYVVYDRVCADDGKFPPLSVSESSAHTNYTLLFPSAEDEKIYIIAEFLNDSDTTITGHNLCVIPPGSRFYLVGELEIPADQISTYGNQVFVSDGTTVVKSKIKDFTGAYNYVPDVLSPALVLSLEINLKWEQLKPESHWLN